MHHVGHIQAGSPVERETADLVCWWHFALEDSLVVSRSVRRLKCEMRIKSSTRIARKDVYLQQHNLANNDKRKSSDRRAGAAEKNRLSLITNLNLSFHVGQISKIRWEYEVTWGNKRLWLFLFHLKSTEKQFVAENNFSFCLKYMNQMLIVGSQQLCGGIWIQNHVMVF